MKLRVKLKKNLKGKTNKGSERERRIEKAIAKEGHTFFFLRITLFKYLNIFRQMFQNLQLLIKIFSLEE